MFVKSKERIMYWYNYLIHFCFIFVHFICAISFLFLVLFFFQIMSTRNKSFSSISWVSFCGLKTPDSVCYDTPLPPYWFPWCFPNHCWAWISMDVVSKSVHLISLFLKIWSDACECSSLLGWSTIYIILFWKMI